MTSPTDSEDRTPRRLQAIWPPPKPKDEEEKVGLKYTEAGEISPFPPDSIPPSFQRHPCQGPSLLMLETPMSGAIPPNVRDPYVRGHPS